MSYKKLSILFITSTFFLTTAAIGQSNYPPAVEKILTKAGVNRIQLETVLSYYASPKDSLKLQAAYYLIGNLEGHSYIISSLYDTNKNKIDFDILDYPNYEALLAGYDSLQKRYGKLDFAREVEYFDVDTITAEYLINQIDLAFQAWREKPWAKRLSFPDFCDYALPYRGSNEPLSNWREFFLERYRDLPGSMKNPSDPVEAAGIINMEIAQWFKFDPRFYFHPTDQGLSDFLRNKLGRCEDMTNITIYAMRSCGIAVTSDFTPYWAKSGNNHAWNAILLPDGKIVPFMGAEANPGSYRLSGETAKVYRKMFRHNKDNLAYYVPDGYKMPPYIDSRDILDVTRDYTEVCEANLDLTEPIPDSSAGLAYLCVFNSGEWKALAWTEISGKKASFKDMGTNIAYLPAYYIAGKIIPGGDPFILNQDGSLRFIRRDSSNTVNLQLNSVTKRVQVVSTDGAVTTNLQTGETYELFYWQNGWQSLGKQLAGDQPLSFKKVPAGCLYWLVRDGSDREEERIFTVEEGKVVWW